MDSIQNFMFGLGLLGNFTYTVRKRYMQEFKFEAGQSMKVKDYWKHLKEIINFLPPQINPLGYPVFNPLSWMITNLRISLMETSLKPSEPSVNKTSILNWPIQSVMLWTTCKTWNVLVLPLQEALTTI